MSVARVRPAPPETWALEIWSNGKCIELASGSPDQITIVYEQMIGLFPSEPQGFRNGYWTLSVRKPEPEDA